MSKIAVIDFETTGLSPGYGDRATEVAVVMVEDNVITARYQSLMNGGKRIPAFIQQLTGITDAMIRKAPPASEVMLELAAFVGDMPFLAHNASFDSKFIDAEWSRIQHERSQPFACSLMLSRRLYPTFHNHKLGTLVQYLQLPTTGKYHRALADAEITAHLVMRIRADLKANYALTAVPHEMLCLLQKAPKAKLDATLQKARLRFGL
jgi:DNA polymerase-3 subunit epsilon